LVGQEGLLRMGLPAKAVTRSYHLAAIPANRARIACDWLLDAVLARQAVQFGLVRAAAVPLDVDSTDPRSGPTLPARLTRTPRSPPPTGTPGDNPTRWQLRACRQDHDDREEPQRCDSFAVGSARQAGCAGPSRQAGEADPR
jgi:hypothetical protein